MCPDKAFGRTPNIGRCVRRGIEPEGPRALHVWTLIHEIPEGNSASGGKIIYYRQVKDLVDGSTQ